MSLSLTIPRQDSHVPIIVERGSADRVRSLECVEKADAVFVLYDEAVSMHADGIAQKLDAKLSIAIPSGEHSKSFEQVQRISQKLLEGHVSRASLIVCIGGGMATDLGGFIASILLRGVRFMMIPTTTLSMCDASIGGKTGIDYAGRKNVIGTFAQPEAIVMDPDLLKTLPDGPFYQGIVEAVKMAATLDAERFAWYEQHMDAIVSRDPETVELAIEHAAAMKIDVVERDEIESEHRMLLNAGHTVGHAVESLSEYKIPHGEAVSIGLIAEMKLAHTPQEDQDRVHTLMEQLQMPTAIPEHQDPEDLWNKMLSDKKTKNGIVRMAVPTSLGSGEVQTLSKEHFLTLFT